MLTDQTFEAVSLIAVGPELFYTPASRPQGVDMEAVHIFRHHVQFTACFRPMLLGMSVTPHIGLTRTFVKTLQDLGVMFSAVHLCDLRSPASVQSCKRAFIEADVVYSPEFSAKLLSRGKDVSNLPRELVLQTIKEMSAPEIGGVYTSQLIYNQILEKWLTAK